jgi:hypothetical protein
VYGIPVPVPFQVPDTLVSLEKNGKISSDSTSTPGSAGRLSPEGVLDSLIVLYPGFRHFVLREEMKKTLPRSRNDSLLAWAKENFAAQMLRNGKIDPATLNQLLMLQQNQNSGPYHITTPGVGVGIPFSYTSILKQIISIFEKAPED